MNGYGIVYKTKPEQVIEYIKKNQIDPKKYVFLHQGNKNKWKEKLAGKEFDKDYIYGISQETLAHFCDKFKGLPDFSIEIILQITIRCYKFGDSVTDAIRMVLKKKNISDDILYKINSQIYGLYNNLNENKIKIEVKQNVNTV